MDRLPWLPDEPCRRPRRKAPRRDVPAGLSAAIAAGRRRVLSGSARSSRRRCAAASFERSRNPTRPLPLPDAAPPRSQRSAHPRRSRRSSRVAAPPGRAALASRRSAVVARRPARRALTAEASRTREPQPRPRHGRRKPSPPCTARPKPAPARSRCTSPWPLRVRRRRVGPAGAASAPSAPRRQAKRLVARWSRDYPALKRLPALVVPVQSQFATAGSIYRFQIGTTSQAHSEVLCQRMQHDRPQLRRRRIAWKAKVER